MNDPDRMTLVPSIQVTPKGLFGRQTETCLEAQMSTTEGPVSCPSCKERDLGYGRYCIHCGSILKPVSCVHCGALNPNDLDRCLECGNLISIHQTVTTPRPTYPVQIETTMINASCVGSTSSEAVSDQTRSPRKSALSRLRARLSRR